MIAVAKTIFVGAAYNQKMIETKSGKSMLAFTLRTWRPKKGQEDKVCFFDIVAYSSAADVLSKYLTDGKLLYLDCTADQYKGKDGQSRVQFIVNEFTFVGDKQQNVQDS